MRIKWTGEARILPKVGIAVDGNVLDVPKEDGLNFIKQGLAVEYNEKKESAETQKGGKD